MQSLNMTFIPVGITQTNCNQSRITYKQTFKINSRKTISSQQNPFDKV